MCVTSKPVSRQHVYLINHWIVKLVLLNEIMLVTTPSFRRFVERTSLYIFGVARFSGGGR